MQAYLSLANQRRIHAGSPVKRVVVQGGGSVASVPVRSTTVLPTSVET